MDKIEALEKECNELRQEILEVRKVQENMFNELKKDIMSLKNGNVSSILPPANLFSSLTPLSDQAKPKPSLITINGVPVSENTAKHQNIGELLEVKTTDMEQIDPEIVKVIKKIRGIDGLLIHYLSRKVINGGRGFIQPTNSFPQHDEDPMLVTLETLNEWPSGFYLNRVTKEVQLLLKTDKFIICFDALPGVDGPIKVILFLNNQLILTDIRLMTKEQLEVLLSEVEIKLKEISLIVLKELVPPSE